MQDLNRDLNAAINLTMRRRTLLLLLAGSIMFVSAGYYLWAKAPAESPDKIYYALGFWFFGAGIPLSILQLAWPFVDNELAPRGLSYRIFGIHIGPIPWNAIHRVDVWGSVGPGSFVTLEVSEPQKYVQVRGTFSRNQARVLQAKPNRPLHIFASMAGVSGPQLAGAIERRIETFAHPAGTSCLQGNS
jgi:hypothetical protein